MALVALGANGVISAYTQLDQYYNLLTGVMTDQEVTLAKGLKFGSSGPAAGPDIHSDGTNIFIETNGAGAVRLRPAGAGNDAGVVLVNASGLTTPALLSTTGTFSGLLSGASATFSGALAANGGLSVPTGQAIQNAGGSGFIVDRGTFSHTYGGGTDNFTPSFNLNFSGRTPIVLIMSQDVSQVWNVSGNANSNNTFNARITGGNTGSTVTFSWIAVG